MDISARKNELRQSARLRRERLAAACSDHAARLSAHAERLGIPRGACVGAYAALAFEADPQALVNALGDAGCRIAFPRVAGRDAPLAFHIAQPGQSLAPGAFGVREPAKTWPTADPGFVLVPLLAFDGRGFRLGFGGGFYDRTLAKLRSKGPIMAIGVAFAGQEVDHVPVEPFDQRLDVVVTELGVRRFGG